MSKVLSFLGFTGCMISALYRGNTDVPVEAGDDIVLEDRDAHARLFV